MPNRLARERSPYLLQHADNPVDWWPWGDDAFARARREDKPIFLSIGYSTCHWCHVMAHESFEDETIASVLNRDFVSIKLDREERPDIDRVYMAFVQATTGAGGWPMSVWLTPDLKPFFGGTYFPPSTRWGRPGFIDVLTQLAGAWKGDRATLVQASNEVIERLREFTNAGQAADARSPVAGRDALDFGVQLFAKSFDPRHGGFGGSPKFPRPSELLFLLQTHALTGDDIAKRMATGTLHAMALGGMRDQVGGGFHRYSVDAEWRVPHFEKMLYDQAQLVLAYLDGAQATGDAFYATVAEDTLDYVRREMTAPDGAFYSAEDADSEVPAAPGGIGPAPVVDDEHAHGKKEGAFYVWSVAEIDHLLGEDADVVKRRYGIEPQGNALSDPQGEFRGQNILYVAQSIEDVAARSGRDADAVMTALARARATLFEARAARPRPHLDDKIITAWNGLMIAAFAHAARVLADSPRREDWRESAVRAATAVRALLWDDQRRRLRRRYRDGEAAIDAFCEDYACLVWGLTELFQATGQAEWLDWAETLVAAQVEQFWDDEDAGWFSTSGDDPSVLLRLKEDYDGAEPSAASVSVRNLITLGQITGDADYTARAARSLERYGGQIGQATRVMPLMVSNVALWNATKAQVVVTGPRESAERHALEATVGRQYLPFAVVVLTDPAAQPALAARLPWLAAMGAGDPAPAAWVCRDFVCQAPERDPGRLSEQLVDIAAPRRIITS